MKIKMNIKLPKIRKEIKLGVSLVSLLAFVLLLTIVILPAIDRAIDRNMPFSHYILAHSNLYCKEIGGLTDEELKAALSHSADSLWDVNLPIYATGIDQRLLTAYEEGVFSGSLKDLANMDVEYLKMGQDGNLYIGFASMSGYGNNEVCILHHYFVYIKHTSLDGKPLYNYERRKVITVLPTEISMDDVFKSGSLGMNKEEFKLRFKELFKIDYPFSRSENNDDYYLLTDGLAHVTVNQATGLYSIKQISFTSEKHPFDMDFIEKIKADYFSRESKIDIMDAAE